MSTNAGFKVLVGVLCLVLVLGVTGCHKKPKVISPGPEGEATTPVEKAGGGEGLPDAELEKLLWSPMTGLQKIYFDYNKFSLRPDALKVLGENAEKIKQALAKFPNTMIQVEGHCDERGSQEYNLALGEKRALSVREHLIKLGIAGDKLVTISYGKERPIAMGHDEDSWKQNRRCEFNKASK